MTPPVQSRPRLSVSRRPQDQRRRELAARPNRTQDENIELILLQQAEIMEHLGIK